MELEELVESKTLVAPQEGEKGYCVVDKAQGKSTMQRQNCKVADATAYQNENYEWPECGRMIFKDCSRQEDKLKRSGRKTQKKKKAAEFC